MIQNILFYRQEATLDNRLNKIRLEYSLPIENFCNLQWKIFKKVKIVMNNSASLSMDNNLSKF